MPMCQARSGSRSLTTPVPSKSADLRLAVLGSRSSRVSLEFEVIA